MTDMRADDSGAGPNQLEASIGRPSSYEATDAVTKALLSRPRLSLRMQLLLGFLLVFLAALGIATNIVISFYRVENSIDVLEAVNDYVVEIDKARRFEKNFFLYRTDLNEALESIHAAKGLLQESREDFAETVGQEQWQGIYRNLVSYEQLLDELLGLERSKGGDAKELTRYESQLRKQGHRMILLAQDLMKKEREASDVAIAGSRRIQVYSLLFLLVFVITTAYLISGNFVRTIERFEAYARGIAAGGLAPIGPSRRYRDEFTELLLAINQMMRELQKHESMLIQAHKMRAIGTLTAGIAHELNNPLNNITITAHMLLEDFQTISDEERKDMVKDIAAESDRAKKIISNLLDFTRESETKPEPLDLVQLVKDTIDLARNQFKIAGIKAELHTVQGLPPIHGDSQQLRQVFLNLVLNAVHASTKGGKIQLLVRRTEEPGHLAVEIADHGTGIPKQVKDRIFDPFFTTKEADKGTGLGLSVSQGIIAKHGGRIAVDSKEGKGSTFTVILPVTTISDVPIS